MKKLLLSTLLAGTGIVFGQTTVHYEDFQSGMPAAYTVVDNDGLTPHQAVSEYTDAWITVQDPDNASDTVAGSTSYFDPAGTADRWLITSAITLGGYGNFLNWEAKSHDASYPDSYQVLISVTDNQITSFTDTLDAVTFESELWQSYEVNLSELGYDDVQTVYFAFVNRTEDGFKLYIDDIRVDIEDPRGLRPVGVDELENEKIVVHPNPTSDYITIPLSDIDNVAIYDLAGKQVFIGNEQQIDVTALTDGSYIVYVQSGERTFHSRFIKR